MVIHVIYFAGLIIAMPLLPLLILQAKKVRRSVPRLSEADINIKGSIGVCDETTRLITLGESTIAGVGVRDHADGISGQIAKTISTLTNKKVEWEVIGKSGYPVKKITEHLASRIPDSGYDIIVIGVGANDTFEFNSTLTWQRNVSQLIATIRSKHKDCPIVIANMPPVGQFPAFPLVMRVILGSLITLHGLALESVLRKFPNVYYVNKPIRFSDWAKRCGNISIKDFFSDGVHPSPLAYALWGKEVGEFIVERKLV